MADKQLDLGQYKLFHLTEMDRILSTEEVKTLLTPGTPTGEGTVQETISDVETVLDYDDREERYLGPVETTVDYENLEQAELDTGVRPETQQAEITNYNNRIGAASD